ncbi:MAG: hypothetical protein HY280_05490 [Nitrospinae bacterium]|nr:hypothetical protein [Nitrospinota bacterium]
MLGTESDAKEHFCPLTFSLASSHQHGEGIFECKASGCMGWNWFDPKSKGKERRGFCGMAGRPLAAET